MPDEVILLTGEVEGPHFRAMLTSLNPGLAVVHTQTREELEAACLKPVPAGGRRLISFSTSVIVPKAVLDGLTMTAYNFHPGPPTYPGSHAASFAIYEGADYFGATAHVMEEKVDCGPIVAAEWFAMLENPRFMELEIKTYELLLKIFADFAPHFATSNDPLPEIDAKWSGAKHTKAEFEAMKVLEADMEETEINLRYRAFG
ncbi:MAG: methionyl-tRNA formyltransferase [Alphaproteobacteria bacterium]|jgi:methionyl-tRNA formyltransferase|nr:methionyl-tRNA formyltransferase [Alphaproteobacteria bacterium]MBT7943702.1 methionyl-tRNA formyltransferase [Alphaproteobacteria bacterium]